LFQEELEIRHCSFVLLAQDILGGASGEQINLFSSRLAPKFGTILELPFYAGVTLLRSSIWNGR
jgi:hypothetical protein